MTGARCVLIAGKSAARFRPLGQVHGGYRAPAECALYYIDKAVDAAAVSD